METYKEDHGNVILELMVQKQELLLKKCSFRTLFNHIGCTVNGLCLFENKKNPCLCGLT